MQLAFACVTVNVVPPIVIVPVRIEVAVFGATLNVTLADPDCDAPPVMVIQDALLTAVHAQAEPAVTALAPLPPVAANDCVFGEIE